MAIKPPELLVRRVQSESSVKAATTAYLQDLRQWRGAIGPNSSRVVGYLRTERRALAAIAILALAYVPCSLVEPYVVQYLVDRIILEARADLLQRFAIAVLPLVALATAVEFLLGYAVLGLARNLHLRIKSDQLDNLLGKNAAFFRNTASGRVLFSFFNDSNQIGTILSLGLVNGLVALLLIAARVVVLWYVDAVLMTLYVVMVIPTQLAVTYRVIRTTLRLEIELKRRDEDLTSGFECLVRGMMTVKALGFGSTLASLWKRRFASRLDVDLRAMLWRQFGSLTTANLHTLATFAVLFVAVHRMAIGSLSLGAVLAFLAVAARIQPSLQALVGVTVGAQEVLVNIERFFRIYDLPNERQEFGQPPFHTTRLTDGDLGELRLRDVVVWHGPARILVRCDMRLEPGGSYLWYGANGVGKTSLAMALAAIVPHTRGSITCGGRPLVDFAIESVRDRIVYVGPEPFWPERTLAETFANTDARLDRRRLDWALGVSAADEVVAALPHGMDTVLSPDAHVLSRGENQRLFLALALYRQPRVILLDEALSSVSVATMRLILQRLRNWTDRPLVVHVSHRRDLYASCDGEIPVGAVA
jgi:subfamily B ATP-binding cassette protein HlyB/CyaB